MKTNSIAVAVTLAFSLCLFTAPHAGATGYTLTLHAQGSGTVVPDNKGNPLPSGAVITITATANPGWYFANWSGDATGTVNPLQVTMNSSLVITGNFLAFPTYTMALTTNGQGAIDLNPPGGSYQSNSVVIATATPATGWVFTGWSGFTNSSANPLSLTLNTNVSLTGTFAQLPAFDSQPASVTNKAGSTVSFSGHAIGTSPLRYQWYFSGGSLPSSDTNSTLSLTNVSSGDAGNYWLVATNNYGSATSHLASLTLTNFTGPTNIVSSADEASLRAAIKIGGWIGLGFNGTLTLTNTITITNNVILDGNHVTATISGGGAVRLFYVAAGASLTVSNLTLANGACIVSNGASGTSADAGAIYNDGGKVTLVSSLLTNNSAQMLMAGYARGGAIFNNGGTVVLCGSVVTSNSALGSTNSAVAIGGAIYQASGSLIVTNVDFVSNHALGGQGGSYPNHIDGEPAYGGGLAICGGSATIDQSRFVTNTVKGGDAGYHSAAGAAFGGAIYSSAAIVVNDSSLFGNQTVAGNSTQIQTGATRGVDGFGGVLYNAGIAVLNRCSIFWNSVQGGSGLGYLNSSLNGGNGLGGGIFNAAQLAATNCTIALNSAIGGPGSAPNYVLDYSGNALGGAIFNNTNATFTAMNLTIASNSCSSPTSLYYTNGIVGGFQIANTSGTLRLHNSILAGGTNAYGTITDDGYNICSDASASLLSGYSYNNTDPKLAPLGNYGGPTLCLALLPISPAIDFGDSAGLPNTDQRGYVRPFGDGPDIGAYEYGSAPLVTPLLNLVSSSSTNIVLSFAAEPPGSYRLQCSTNLLTWTDLNTNGPFASSTNVTQSIAKQGFQSRYFRLLMQ